MRKLSETYKTFRRLKFPKTPTNDILDDIFTDLVQYDSHVAGSVDKLLKGKAIKSTDLYFDIGLEKRIQEFISQAKNQDDLKNAETYLQYLDNLRELIRVAEAAK